MKTSSRDSPIPSSSSFEQLPGAADEGQALAVLFGPGRLADEHQVGVGVAGAEHRLGARLVQRALGAGLDLAVELDQLGAPLLGGRSPTAVAAAFPRARLRLVSASRSPRAASRSRRLRLVGPHRRPARLAPAAARPGEISRRVLVGAAPRAGGRRVSAAAAAPRSAPALLALELVDRARPERALDGGRRQARLGQRLPVPAAFGDARLSWSR